MLLFNKNKKRKRPERLNMQQKEWIREQIKSEPNITEKKFSVTFLRKIQGFFNMAKV